MAVVACADTGRGVRPTKQAQRLHEWLLAQHTKITRRTATPPKEVWLELDHFLQMSVSPKGTPSREISTTTPFLPALKKDHADQ